MSLIEPLKRSFAVNFSFNTADDAFDNKDPCSIRTGRRSTRIPSSTSSSFPLIICETIREYFNDLFLLLKFLSFSPFEVEKKDENIEKNQIFY